MMNRRINRGLEDYFWSALAQYSNSQIPAAPIVDYRVVAATNMSQPIAISARKIATLAPKLPSIPLEMKQGEQKRNFSEKQNSYPYELKTVVEAQIRRAAMKATHISICSAAINGV